MKFYDEFGDEITFWEHLEEQAKAVGEQSLWRIRRFRKRCEWKDPRNSRVRYVLWPWGEINRLNAFIRAMRQQEHEAAINTLGLYNENESLRRYKELHDKEMHQFVHIDDYNTVKSELQTTKGKLAKVSVALDRQAEEWNTYMKAHR